MYRRSRGVYVASPEFCFLEMASQMSLVSLVKLGFEMCGHYSIPVDGSETVYDLQPMTSVTMLGRFLDGVAGAHGVKRARQALRLVRPGSASPMETVAVSLFTFPTHRGGRSLGSLQMNAVIEATDTARRIARQDHFVCDLYWPGAKQDIEYDSDEFHCSRAKLHADALRRDGLSSMGVDVMSLTSNQVFDLDLFNAIADAVERKLGKRVRRDASFPERQRELLRELQSDLWPREPTVSRKIGFQGWD